MKKKKSAVKKRSSVKTGQGGSNIIPFPGKGEQEGMMSDLFGGRSERTPLDMAQDVAYDAMDAPTSKKRIALAQKALSVSPDCADAYVVLAQESRYLQTAAEFYRKGVEAGERAIGGKKGFKAYGGHFWLHLETRPYMRARAGLADRLWLTGRVDEAFGHYKDMLRLNPNDNQGIRYILVSRLLSTGRDAEAAELLREYEDDASAEWVYAQALLSFRKNGDCDESRNALAEAMKYNKHAPDYLLGIKKIPRSLPDYIGFGDESEAIAYAEANIGAWKATQDAMEWLAAMVKRDRKDK